MTAGVEGSVEPEDAALDNLRDRRPGVFGDGVPVPAVDQALQPVLFSLRRLSLRRVAPLHRLRIAVSTALHRTFFPTDKDFCMSKADAVLSRPERVTDTMTMAPYAPALLGEDEEGSVMELLRLQQFYIKKLYPTAIYRYIHIHTLT